MSARRAAPQGWQFLRRCEWDVHQPRRDAVRSLAAWSHEEIFAALGYFEADLPPCYGWPRGYQVGTGPWAARQFAPSVQAAWAEVHQIDAEIVREAAAYLPSAREFADAGN